MSIVGHLISWHKKVNVVEGRRSGAVIVYVTDRPGVTNTHAVERVQDIYTDTLIEYVKKRRVDSSRFLAKLLLKLVDLRTINCLHTDCLYQLTIAKGSLPPLLREYFDIPQPD